MDETIAAGPTTEPRPWAGLLTWIAFWLAVIAGLQILGATLAGLTVELDPRLPLGTAYKVGYSLLTSLDAFPIGLVLLCVVVLVALLSVAGATLTDRQERIAALALGITVAFSFLLMFLSILAVLARVEVLDLQGRDVSSTVRWVLLTFIIRNLGMATLAFAGSLLLLRSRLDLGPIPAAPTPPGWAASTGSDPPPADRDDTPHP